MATGKLFGNAMMNGFGSGASGGSPMDYLSDTWNLMLLTSSYTPAQNTNNVYGDISANEVANGNGYTTKGTALASKTLGQSSGTTTFDAADTTFSTLTKTHRYGVIYDDTPTTPADPLFGYVDTGGDQTNAATDLTYQWHASGIATITVAA